jgi:hypothetical protein
MLSTPTNAARRLLLLLLAVSLTACATHSPSVVPPAAIPKPPAELLERQSEPYLQNAQELFKRWLRMLSSSRES